VRVDVKGRGSGRVRLQGDARLDVIGGIEWGGDAWHRIADEQHDTSGTVALATGELDELGLRVALYTQVELRFYGLVGPYIQVGAYGEVDHPIGSTDVRGSVGVYGEVGGEMRFRRFDVPVMPDIDLFDVSKPVY
jgi:hypothetical protein